MPIPFEAAMLHVLTQLLLGRFESDGLADPPHQLLSDPDGTSSMYLGWRWLAVSLMK